MVKFLVPVVSAVVLGLASASAANAGAWGAFYPHGAHDTMSDQSDNDRPSAGRTTGQAQATKLGSGASASSTSVRFSGGIPGNGGSNGGGNDGISRSAPGPVLGLGLPALIVAGGYVFLRRRAQRK